jgi:short-subunit dehydrogenase
MPPRTVLITGASSGIGAALARKLAAPERTLLLWGRDQNRLAAVAQDCRAGGAAVETEAFDLRDGETMMARLAAADSRLAVELAIFNAGLGGSVPAERLSEDPNIARAMADINFTAPVTGASLIADGMARRRGGHIVLIGSVAGDYPLPMAPAYAGAKAGLARFADALGVRMQKHDVAVTLVAPGFIDTPMIAGVTEPKPFLISADRAAEIILGKLVRRPRRLTLPWQFAALRALSFLVPGALVRAVLRRI